MIKKSLTLAVASALASGPLMASTEFLENDVETLRSYVAENSGDGFGWVAENIGDLNADGVNEYAITAPNFGAGGSQQGKVYVYDGATGDLIASHTGQTGEQLGRSVAGVGDVDNDGVVDYAAGAPGSRFTANNIGSVYLWSGRDHTLIRKTSDNTPDSLYGYDINAAGDVNNDGSGDVIVGAITTTTNVPLDGKVILVSGKDGAVLWSQIGQSQFAVFGTGVSGMGDINGDGVADQVVGSFQAGANFTGLGYFLDGTDGSILHTIEPLPSAGTFGWFFAHAAGDVNNDGVPDAYIGDFSDSSKGQGTGMGYVLSGVDGSYLHTFPGEKAGDNMGIGRGAGDVNGDGHDDLLLAAWVFDSIVEDQTISNAGKGYVYSGRNGALLWSFTGTQPGHSLGFDIVPLEDVTADGNDDYLITGVDIAHVVVGADLSIAGRLDTTCTLIAGIPDSAFTQPVATHKHLLCNQLKATKKILNGNNNALNAVKHLRKQVVRRMDGNSGGEASDDWLTEPTYQQLVLQRVEGILVSLE